MLKIFFFSERRFDKCNFKSKTWIHEEAYFSWNLKLFAIQKTDFNVLLLFCSLSYVRAAMHRITSLELLGTLIAGLQQKKANK